MPTQIASVTDEAERGPVEVETSPNRRRGALRFAALASAFACLGAFGATFAGPDSTAVEAEASIEVGPASDAATVRALGSLPLVLEPAAAVVSVDAETLARNVEFRTVEGTRLVTIRARAASSATALTAAEAVANSLIAASGSNTESRGRILGPARLASAPTTPWSRATRGALSGVAIAAAVVALLTTPRASPPDGEAIGNPR